MAESSAECSFGELIQSKLFTFYVGKGRKAFQVHSKAVAATSHQLNALVNNDMAESQMGCADLEDDKPDDFARYVEYAYRWDYTVPSWEEVVADIPDPPPPLEPEEAWPEPESEPEPEVVEEVTLDEPEIDVVEEVPPSEPVAPDGWGRISTWSKKGKKTLRSSFEARNYLQINEPKVSMLRNFRPQFNSAPEQNFTPVFLAHARLYTFATFRLIHPLKRLTLHKLHKTLLGFQLYDRRVNDVIELAKYAYDHGEDRKDDGTIEDLRKLVVEYMACEVSTFGKHKDFVRLLEEGGEFVGDFWRIVFREEIL